jgi:DNA polymerase III alpha subunit
MKVDQYGQHIYNEEDLCNLYLTNPEISIKHVLVDSPIHVSEILDLTNIPTCETYTDPKISVQKFDLEQQSKWMIPDEYRDFNIAEYVLNLCQTDEELQRVGEELLLYHERNMFPLLVYLKYLVDTLRKHNIVWGVGRGSSVSSYVLFLIGVHRINSIFYDLSINEFLR